MMEFSIIFLEIFNISCECFEYFKNLLFFNLMCFQKEKKIAFGNREVETENTYVENVVDIREH